MQLQDTELNGQYSFYYITWIKQSFMFNIKRIRREQVDFVLKSNPDEVIKFRHGNGSNHHAFRFIRMFKGWMKVNYPDVDMSICFDLFSKIKRDGSDSKIPEIRTIEVRQQTRSIEIKKRILEIKKKRKREAKALEKTTLRKVEEWRQYSEYIKSKEWNDKSESCKLRAKYKCESCGETGELNAHHYNYITLYRERESDLFCLCNMCHFKYHRQVKNFQLPKDTNLPREIRLLHIIETINKK